MFRNILMAMALCLVSLSVPGRVFSQEADLTHEGEFLRLFVSAGGQIDFGPTSFPTSIFIGGKTIVYSFSAGKVNFRVIPTHIDQFHGDYALSVEHFGVNFARVRVFSLTDSVIELTPKSGVAVVGSTKLVTSPTGITYIMAGSLGLNVPVYFTDYYAVTGERVGSIIGFAPTFVFGENAVVTRKFVGRVSGNDNLFERVDRLDLNTGQATSAIEIIQEGTGIQQ